jgi:hypothetical protein
VNEIIFARLTRSLQRRFGWCLRAIFKDMGSYSACLASTSRYDLTSSQMVIISISSGGIWFVCPETPGTPETHTKNNVSARKRISRSNSFYQYPTYSPSRPSPAGGYERHADTGADSDLAPHLMVRTPSNEGSRRPGWH